MARTPARTERMGRDRLLDAAEALFARRGYSGASLREIARAAGVELGLAGYHFGSKDELFRMVMARRAPEICTALLAALDLTEAAAGGGAAPVAALLDAYVSAHIDRLASADEGWRHYIKLAGHSSILEERDELTAPLRREYQPVQRRYRAALRRALPRASRYEIETAFYIFRLSVATVAGDGGWRGSASADRPISDYAAVRRALVDLFSSGFEGLGVRKAVAGDRAGSRSRRPASVARED